MLFYLNTGYSGLFKKSTFTSIISDVYNSKNGMVVYGGKGSVEFDIVLKTFYGKFDIYPVSSSLNGVQIVIGSSSFSSGFVIGFDSSSVYYRKLNGSVYSVPYSVSGNNLHSLYVYSLLPTNNLSNGAVKVVLDDIVLLDISNDTFVFGREPYITIISNSNDIYLSNFILTSFSFDSKCEIAESNISSSNTNMGSVGDGFQVSSNDQWLLQTLDLSFLKTKYGKKSNVIGIALVNMYTDVDPHNHKFSAIEKQNNSYVKLGTFELSDKTNDFVLYSQKFANNVTLNTLHSKSYGWVSN